MMLVINFRYALRTLSKAPFVTICAIVSIALGIGANTAMFSVFERMLLHPLPVQEPGRLVNLAVPGPRLPNTLLDGTGEGYYDEAFNYPMFRDLEKIQTVFTGIAAHHLFIANLAARGETVNGQGLFVSGSYFPILGVRAALGRLLSPQDDHTIGETPVVVLSYGYWKTRFGQDPGVLNQTMVINGQVMTIVGVVQSGFEGTTLGSKPQVFVPITMRGLLERGLLERGPNGFDSRMDLWVYLFARLKPGIAMEQASATLNGQYHAIINEVEVPLLKGITRQALEQFRAKSLALSEGSRGQSILAREGVKTILTINLGLAAFVLIIACANVANLLLVRGAARAGEMAVRMSIGASRPRVVAQLLAESCLLALFAGIASVPVAQWTLDSIVSLLPAEAAGIIPFTLNRSALIFAAALTLGTGLLFGLFPALHITQPNLVLTLRGQAGQPSGAKSATRFRSALAIAQIALSLALLVIAGLFTKSLFNLSRVSLGMDVDHVITFTISPFRNGYTLQGSLQLFERLEDELAALPGVTNVSDSLVPLLTGAYRKLGVSVEGYKIGLDENPPLYNEIGAAYFRTLGIPLISGREFVRSDAAGAPKVAIVNQAFADKFNLGRDAVGKHIGDTNSGFLLDAEIVGLVQNAKSYNVRTESEPMFFRPYRQDNKIEYLSFYVQTPLNPEQLFPGIRKMLARNDPNLPVENLRTMPHQVRDSTFIDRVMSILSAAFACLAILLAAVGLYGVLAYTMALRTREIGLRMALGASPAQVRSMVFRKVGMMIFVGSAIGLALAIAFGRVASVMLYQLQGSDPAVLCSATVVLALVGLIAGFIPAYRASKIDPMQALRYE